jgi:hypothetical protein
MSFKDAIKKMQLAAKREQALAQWKVTAEWEVQAPTQQAAIMVVAEHLAEEGRLMLKATKVQNYSIPIRVKPPRRKRGPDDTGSDDQAESGGGGEAEDQGS